MRMGFSIKHFLSEIVNNQDSISDNIKKGFENTDVSRHILPTQYGREPIRRIKNYIG